MLGSLAAAWLLPLATGPAQAMMETGVVPLPQPKPAFYQPDIPLPKPIRVASYEGSFGLSMAPRPKPDGLEALQPHEASRYLEEGLVALPVRKPARESLKVIAVAYNAVPSQTDSTPTLGACGVHLREGMKAIAVSRDLFRRGLNCGHRISISGLPGEYVVLDKMNKRWRQKIDIFMGSDVRRALRWGRRRVEISWPKE